ncbi:hypothetical protein [Domibacillus robiginosus]|uniref:hypothetical protein n=1 Tax=Domibacillus robiginosus TaxID=1071054 RepID=UPI00067DC847|nr:hypothetical protein [Domibacillus robiginosus]
MFLTLQLKRLVDEVEQKNLNENEEYLLEIIKLLVEYREFDTSSALFELKTDIKYFWQRLAEFDKEIKEIRKQI